MAYSVFHVLLNAVEMQDESNYHCNLYQYVTESSLIHIANT